MNTQYFCKNKGRRKAVTDLKDDIGNPIINGIDYLEVVSTDQRTLEVHFLHKLTGQTSSSPPSTPELKKENIIIDGGVRIKNIRVEEVEIIGVDEDILKVIVNEAGNFSTYTLQIVNSITDLNPPSGFDPQLSEIEFSFKVNCPSEFDCKPSIECRPEELIEPEINYLAKDYASFRRLILDRLSIIMPNWQERNAADLQIALVELLAYVGDHLSYFQDAVATEAYLRTARKRISVRRHARLLDYLMHDGCNARTWICIGVDKDGDAESQKLPVGTQLLTKDRAQKIVVTETNLNETLENVKSVVFETMHDITLHSSHNEIQFYIWNDSECCLPRGSTRATLLNEPSLFLEPDDVLIFEEVYSSTKKSKADADPAHRHAVRLIKVTNVIDQLNGKSVLGIEWHKADALPFPLCISAIIDDADGVEELKNIIVARGNVVLADHGRTATDDIENYNSLLIPDEVPTNGHYHPKLHHKNISYSIQYDHELAKKMAASSLLEQDPHKALPSGMNLKDNDEKWTVQHDLLASDRFKADFVVEVEQDKTAYLRFGDNVMGKKPSMGTNFLTTYRVGNGSVGNVGADVITQIVTHFNDIQSVRNPMPTLGGTDPETIEEVRQFAPHAFQTKQRAVTAEDYTEMTQRHLEVQKASASFRWTGSWYTVFIIIDRKGGWNVDIEFKNEIRQHLEQYRLAGYDLEINGPVFVPLEIKMMVCVKPGYFKSHVKQNLIKVFSNQSYPGGQSGLFHPDNFTFGQSVFLSQIYQHAMEVAGVASVNIIDFNRWGKTPNKEKENGYLKPESVEIIRLDNDPNFPENGKIEFEMRGGL